MKPTDNIEDDEPGDSEDLESPRIDPIRAYAEFIRHTLKFGDRINRDHFWRTIGLNRPVLDVRDPEKFVREYTNLTVERTKSLCTLKNLLESDPFNLVVARNISDKILSPSEVESFARETYRIKEREASSRLERRLEVVERYRQCGLLQDQERAKSVTGEQSRTNRGVDCNAFGTPIE